MSWVGKILGTLGILFLVFMGVMFFYMEELKQEAEIRSIMLDVSSDVYNAVKLRDYDAAYKNIETYEEACFEYTKETREFNCYEDIPVLFNQIKKEQEQEKQELLDMFKFHIDLLEDDTSNALSLVKQMHETKYGSVEEHSLQFQYKTAYGEYSNHVDSFIKFLDENEEELIQEGITAIEQQKWKNLHLDGRSSRLVFINSFEK